jgi:hypothetical protein
LKEAQPSGQTDVFLNKATLQQSYMPQNISSCYSIVKAEPKTKEWHECPF